MRKKQIRKEYWTSRRADFEQRGLCTRCGKTEPDTIQILCFNCNCGRARNGGICPHETD